MGKVTAPELMEKIFNNIYNAIIPTPLDETIEPKHMLGLMLPGTTIDDALNPKTISGQQAFYAYVNRIPAVAKNFTDSSRTVTNEYKKILGAITKEDSVIDTRLQQQYEEAKKIVWDDAAEEYSKKYKLYSQHKDKYDEAHRGYLSEKNKADADADRLQQLYNNQEKEYKDWIVAGKAEIEQALAIMTRYRAFTPATIFSNAIAEFQFAEVSGYYPVIISPSTWFDKPDSLSWEKMQLTESSESDHVHKEVTSLSSNFSASFKAGLWGGSASGHYKDELEKVQTSSKIESFGLSLEIARVDIIREWYNGGLLGYENVFIDGVKKFGICTGTLVDTNNSTFPIIPTALIVARNITAYNNFSDTEQNFMHKAKSWGVDVKVSYGPFSLGNSTESSTDLTDDEKDQFKASAKINIGKEMQIIGIISSVQPNGFPLMEPPTPKTNTTYTDLLLLNKCERAITRILNQNSLCNMLRVHLGGFQEIVEVIRIESSNFTKAIGDDPPLTVRYNAGGGGYGTSLIFELNPAVHITIYQSSWDGQVEITDRRGRKVVIGPHCFHLTVHSTNPERVQRWYRQCNGTNWEWVTDYGTPSARVLNAIDNMLRTITPFLLD